MNKSFRHIGRDLKKHQALLEKLLDKAEGFAKKNNDEKLLKYLQKERVKLAETLKALSDSSASLYPDFQKELKKRTGRLEVRIRNLNKSKETLKSDNFLLEYKKKDLLLLTTKLEEAYEEISEKNDVLMAQQVMISEVREELISKNEELEMQKEALLDQSDYLHEANEAITRMHREVEDQKNEILKKNEELLTLNNEKNNLIGIVAHDLKSPLNQIKGLLSLMRITNGELSQETLSYIDMMEKSSGRLSDMIGKILDVEAIESQKLNLAFDCVDLSALLSSLAERYALPASQKEITICYGLTAEVLVTADKGYAEQVFENLLSNAVKFSPPRRNVFINLTQPNGKVVCEIRDEGPGLTESDKKKLFGKYQKLSAKPTGNETSTGLGLSIVKKFVEAMHGKIWCESEAGKGASFFVSLPASRS